MPHGSLREVREFWERASCGEELYLKGREREHYESQARERYRLEPFIAPFAEFERYRGKKVLEIGVGLGADHQRFAEAGAELTGIDLTESAVEHVRRRFDLFGLKSELSVGNAESFEFPDATFDLVYSWGVVHHTEDPPRAVSEIWRVLRPGAEAKVMIYHKYSMVGYMLWLRYALLRGSPLTPLEAIYSHHLENPGTKAYSIEEARRLFQRFHIEELRTWLTHGDLLTSQAGQRHRGLALTIARKVWPRGLIRALLPSHGLFLTIKARKPLSDAARS